MKKNLKKIISVVLAVIMIMSLIPTMASAKESKSYGEIEGIKVKDRIVLSIGQTYKLTKPKKAQNISAVWYGDNDYSVETIYDEESDYYVATELLARNEGVELVRVTAYNDYFDDEGYWVDEEIIEEYWLIVVVKPYGKSVDYMGSVSNVYTYDVTVNCKDENILWPDVEIAGNDGAYFCTYYVPESGFDSQLGEDGYYYAYEPCEENVTCYVIDAQGNIVSDNFTFTVKYSFGQWIVHYLLFGWLWDIISGFIYF